MEQRISKRLARILCCAALLLGTSDGTAREADGMLDFDCHIGTWQCETGNGIAYERWTKVSDRTFEGDGFSIVGDDTTHLEFLRLEQFGGEVFLCSKISAPITR